MGADHRQATGRQLLGPCAHHSRVPVRRPREIRPGTQGSAEEEASVGLIDPPFRVHWLDMQCVHQAAAPAGPPSCPPPDRLRFTRRARVLLWLMATLVATGHHRRRQLGSTLTSCHSEQATGTLTRGDRPHPGNSSFPTSVDSLSGPQNLRFLLVVAASRNGVWTVAVADVGIPQARSKELAGIQRTYEGARPERRSGVSGVPAGRDSARLRHAATFAGASTASS
jgi:hypothetical protein